MAFSVDDLVSSLSNNHIGQEAIDLAALHAQLAQAIVAQQSGFTRPTKPIKPCTTPTSATVAYPWNHCVSPMAMDDMEYQDERMVEELLLPCGQVQANPEASFPTCTSDHGPAIDPPAPSSPSLFTSTDPFYIAQLREETQTRFRGSSWCDGQILAYAHAGGGGALGGLGSPDETSPFLRAAQVQAQAQAQAQLHHQQAQQYQQYQQQRTGDVGSVGDSYTAVQYTELLYQLEQMYYHHYYPATAVESC